MMLMTWILGNKLVLIFFSLILSEKDKVITWVKVFRIIPEFRIFEADFPQKVSLKMLN